MNRFTSVLQIRGFPLKKAEKELRDIQLKLNTPNSDYTTNQAWAIFNFHKQYNGFYGHLLKGKTITKWEDVPVMTKQDLQIPLAQRLSRGFSQQQVFVNKTSGSSGHPFIFAKDKFTHALTWAHIMHIYSHHSIEPGRSLEARFYGIPKDFKGHQKERLKDLMARRYRFDIFDLSDANLEIFVHVFQQKPFDYINGYTSSIVMFAKYLEKQNLVLKEICPSLKICITTSEMLFDEDRKFLEDVFAIPIVNEYGASELGVMAFEDENGDWILNNQTLFFEIVDANGKVLADGHEGEVVVTSLYNKAHPFIRYKVGDFGIVEKSNSERPILQKLTGRTNVFAVLPSGKKVPALSFYYVTKSVIEDNGKVKEFKVIQETKKTFLIKYVAEAELSLNQLKSIEKAIEKYLEPGLILKFERHEALQRTERGKLRQFESFVNRN